MERLPLEDFMQPPPGAGLGERRAYAIHQLCLANLQNGRIDPYADPEVVRSVLTWALNIAKAESAADAREAFDAIRFEKTEDETWERRYKSNVEFLWRTL